MLHIYLDTALLAVPNYGYGTKPANVQELIDRVIHFSIVLTEDLPLRVVVADNVEDALGADYPDPQSIQEFLDAEDLAHAYSANDLWQQYLTVLDRAARPGSLGSFEVYNASAFSADPPLPSGLGPAALLSESQRVFTTVGVQSDQQTAWRIGSSMNGTGRQQFTVTATVDAASHDPSPIDGPLAFTFTRAAKTLENLRDLADIATAEELWRHSQSAEDLHMAVSLGALALRRTMHPDADVTNLKPFSIGSEFLSSLAQHNCAGTQQFSSTTFELCAQIIADIGIASIEEMGRPHQEKRRRDNAGAHRTHITGGNPALRLMHWQTATEIEFANVGLKKALHIEIGAAGEQKSVDLTGVQW